MQLIYSRRMFMDTKKVELMPHLPKEVVGDISGFKLDAYLIALEGWRRGLTLKWYKAETSFCKLERKTGSTHGRFFSLSSKDQTHYFISSRGDMVANKSVMICQSKEETKSLIGEKGVPVTKGKSMSIDDNALFDYADEIGFPVVIKPANGSMGRGVYTNIKTQESLKAAVDDFKTRYRYTKIIMERHYFGNEYRIYVVGDKVIGATNRVPANVEGDGVHTVEELIQKKNNDRQGNPYLKSKPIKVDYEIKVNLKESGYDLDSVLTDGEILGLRKVSNLSAGGDPLDYTDELTDEVKQIAVDGLNALPSIPHAGVDVIVDPEDNRRGHILEVNATAEIAFHMFPWEGKGRDVSGAIVDYYFPESVGARKSPWYFEYQSVLEPLKTWSVDELTISKAPDYSEKVYGKQFIVSGKVLKTGYMTYIRKQALKRDMHGYAKKHGNRSIEMTVLGNDKEALDEFFKICKKGSKKSSVENVQMSDINVDGIPFQMGFEIRTTKKTVK